MRAIAVATGTSGPSRASAGEPSRTSQSGLQFVVIYEIIIQIALSRDYRLLVYLHLIVVVDSNIWIFCDSARGTLLLGLD